MTVTSEPEVYYDPYDFDIDADPYPVWKRLRDEAPLYWNEKYEFFALSRWDDVDAAMLDWKTYISGRGSVLEIIKAGVEIPPGSILFEDPPTHDLHRGLLSRVFTPKKMQALEPQVRAYLRRGARPARRDRGVSTSSRTWASSCPCGSSACCSASPSEDQEAIRERLDDGLRLEEGVAERDRVRRARLGRGVLRLHHLAGRAPLRRPDDRAAQRRVRGRARHDAHADPRRDPRLRRPAGRGRERDHDAPDRLHRRGPGPPPGPARRAGGGPVARSPTPSRSCCATRRPRPCSPATSPRDVEVHGTDGARGQHHGAAERLGQPGRAPLPRRRQLRHPPRHRPAPVLRLRHPPLPRARRWPGSRAGWRSTRC